ncbi:MAG: DUF4253 domain-containing protein, partial [Solirubrobacteraceae bacterium]
APSVEDVLATLRDPQRERHRWSASDDSPTENELDRLLFEWEEREAPTAAPELADYDDWFVPPPHFASHLLFLPTPRGPESLAYLDFYGIEQGVLGVTAERLIAVLTLWEERFGAELVANWGTMLQFAVSRPPDTLDAAWELAVDLDLIGPSDKAWVRNRDGARFLWRRPTWFVHCRP